MWSKLLNTRKCGTIELCLPSDNGSFINCIMGDRFFGKVVAHTILIRFEACLKSDIMDKKQNAFFSQVEISTLPKKFVSHTVRLSKMEEDLASKLRDFLKLSYQQKLKSKRKEGLFHI